MNTLMSIFLGALAVTVAILTVQAIRSGEVKWRNGSIAATRSEDPGLFWGIVFLQTIACVAMVGSIFS